jgi:hypothetical protein
MGACLSNAFAFERTGLSALSFLRGYPRKKVYRVNPLRGLIWEFAPQTQGTFVNIRFFVLSFAYFSRAPGRQNLFQVFSSRQKIGASVPQEGCYETAV